MKHLKEFLLSLVICFTGAALVFPALALEKHGGQSFRDCDGCPEMVWLPPGPFLMGAQPEEPGRWSDEGPQHLVTIDDRFAIGVHEITVGEFKRFVSETGFRFGSRCRIADQDVWEWRDGYSWQTPGFPQTDRHPVVCVSQEDAQAFLKWLRNKTGQFYRLPTEAEWEYAVRAGTQSAFFWGSQASRAHANYGRDTCCGPVAQGQDRWVYTAPVGSFRPNGFGLHDLSGNVWEWVSDCWHPSYEGAPADGRKWSRAGCKNFIMRGGSWLNGPAFIRSADRNFEAPSFRSNLAGFRVVRTSPRRWPIPAAKK